MNRVKPRTLSGFMELYPEEQILFNKYKDIIRKNYEKYGFLPLDTPVIESSEVLLAKAGGETEKQIYRFNKGDNDLSLRFDLTVPLAKYVAARYNELVFPFKRYQIGKVYRGERAQKGRFREFYQCDIDVIGNKTLNPIYDAILPSVIYGIFKEMNIGKFIIRINNRKVFNSLFKKLDIEDKQTDILRIIDKIDKIGKEEVRNELNLITDKAEDIMNFLNIDGSNEDKIKSLKDMGLEDGVNELEMIINYLKELEIEEDYYKIDLTITRGLDYYTGTVYETFMVDYPEMGSICSGGRYEDLAGYYTDKKLPGVGISIGLTRLFSQLLDKGIIKVEAKTNTDVLLIPFTDNLSYTLKLSKYFRDNNLNTDIYFEGKNLKQKIKYADKIKVRYVCIIGDDEINNNIVNIKDMYNKTSVNLSWDDAIKYLKGE